LMWFFAPPQKWYEVPGWLWQVWTAGRPEARPGDARPGEAPSRPATAQPWGTASRGRRPIVESVELVRLQVDRMWPEDCCAKMPMVAAGKRSMVCSDDCPWQKLELLVANASVDAEG